MNDFCKILVRIVITSILLILADLVVGTWSEWMYYSSKYGIFHRQIYCIKESDDELLIMGSSRADHQYVSSIFSDSLCMSTYNAGSEGMCIYYQYAILGSYVERRSFPKMVILDVQDLDVIKSLGMTFTLEAALDRLAPHYGEYNVIDELFDLQGWKEKIKMQSKTYRYNSKLVQTIKCNYIPSHEDRGYEAVAGNLPDDIKFENTIYDNGEIELEKVNYFIKFIELCKKNNIKLLVVYSPIYMNSATASMKFIKKICEKRGVDFWDYSNDPYMIKHEYFRDTQHLNDNGAHVWSSYLSHIIKTKYLK